jgi:hypothetical protein
MKAILNYIILINLIGFIFIGSGCANKSSNNNTTTSPTCNNTVINGNQNGYGYYISNGYCYGQNGQATSYTVNNCPVTNCNSNNSGYYLRNGYCYSSNNPNGQPVDGSYCVNLGNNGSTSGPCYGNYYYNNNGYQQQFQCNGSNCSGITMTEASSGRQVYCQ